MLYRCRLLDVRLREHKPLARGHHGVLHTKWRILSRQYLSNNTLAGPPEDWNISFFVVHKHEFNPKTP